MAARPWWRDGVLYQLYPRSFADSDGDGIGDLRGIVEHLDHLAWLGVDGLWLNPTFPSPNADWGFDVADYRDVHPDLGTLADLEDLIAAAGERGIRVLLDLVPNHTSDEHPWFVEARGDRDASHRDWYVWRDPGPDGRPPNNWQSLFGGPAWEPDGATGQSYLHLFHRKQPDLNWWSEDVRRAFDEILGFWYDRGVAGFRIDVANGIVKDRALRDNPAFATPEEEHAWRPLGQVPRHSLNQPEVHDVFRRWRALGAGRDPEPLLLGETVVRDLEQLMRFYGDDDGLQLALNVVFLDAALDATELAGVVARTEALLPDGAWPLWTASNHDVVRFPTRWGQGDERRIRLALMLLLTLRGTPILYYGDEIGMREAEVPAERVLDPVGLRDGSDAPGRDGARTPMPWTDAAGAGFTAAGVEPWLPFGDLAVNVAAQRADAGSVLHLVRDLIALRRADDALHAGPYTPLDAPDGAWAYRRGGRAAVALNLSDAHVVVRGLSGRVEIGTDRARDGEALEGAVALGPWEGVVAIT
jgi:alpha-glucosidase